jgi:hypothetical protein
MDTYTLSKSRWQPHRSKYRNGPRRKPSLWDLSTHTPPPKGLQVHTAGVEARDSAWGKHSKQPSATEFVEWFFARQDDEDMADTDNMEDQEDGLEVDNAETVIDEEQKVAMCLGREFEELVQEQLEYERQLGLFEDSVHSVLADGGECRAEEEVDEEWDVVSEGAVILEEWEVVSI